ncbi:hypothetical protein GcC1_220036 [Golovinomyces cichoracearum]|uniref:54S ribosomal protein L11, mitochondrial n=1 Tax=Golovinomyces cichoracearum TaxID=62708 RepID=A0A420H7Y7_9PEZI|nr:hypothetical protein GcC1_220036 [Golovinomyces cichoracearum]
MISQTITPVRICFKLSRPTFRLRYNVTVSFSTTSANRAAVAAETRLSPSTPGIPSYPSTQPPSHKPPHFRKSQLLRQYASLLRSSSLILLLQHNNIKANEWLALRRELTIGMRNVDESREKLVAASGSDTPPLSISPYIKIKTVQTGIFAAALRIVDNFKPDISNSENRSPFFKHTLSKAANRVASKNAKSQDLAPLLSGPICVLAFPFATPAYLKEAISIISPNPPDFPAPKKKASPGWHDPAVQEAVKKLVLLGARIEGRAFDTEGVKMIGKIEGGLEGLQGQLVSMLQNSGSSLSNVLESAGKNLYFVLQSRKTQLEEDGASKAGA